MCFYENMFFVLIAARNIDCGHSFVFISCSSVSFFTRWNFSRIQYTVYIFETRKACFIVSEFSNYTKFCQIKDIINRGYSNFLLNIAFISSSEVENIYVFLELRSHKLNRFIFFTSRVK